MIPMFWFFAPQVHFPFGGSVAQHIQPDTQWFFAGIPKQAGDAEVEREAIEVASYGRQLGLISEVLLAMNAPGTVSPQQGEVSLQRLIQIHQEVEDVKRRHRGRAIETALTALERLHKTDPQALALLLQQFAAAETDAHVAPRIEAAVR